MTAGKHGELRVLRVSVVYENRAPAGIGKSWMRIMWWSGRGPPDRDPMIHIPAGVLRVLNNAKINWNYLSEGEPGTAGRALQWPRGKTLGGTSSINGMLYVRGNPADYDGWAQMGCRGWSYDEVLPFFRKSETYRGNGDPEYRSQGGPLIVEDYRTILPLTHHFVEAAKEAGFAYPPH